MHKYLKSICSLIALLLFVVPSSAQDQLNPTAEADEATVHGYLDAIIANDLATARSFLADSYKGYGPATTDSTDADGVVATWTENHATYSDVKVTKVSHTWLVPEGQYAGKWVAVWGNYSAHHNALDVTATTPFQFTARVDDGKIMMSVSYFDNLGFIEQLGGKAVMPGEE